MDAIGDSMAGVFQGFDIAAAGLRAELLRSEVVAANISNMHVAGGRLREPYRRRSVVFEEVLDAQAALAGSGGTAPAASPNGVARGVRVARVVEDHVTPFVPKQDPGHPDADENGFVLMPNVDVFKEMVDLAVIRRSFEANLTTMRTYRGLLQSAVANIGRA